MTAPIAPAPRPTSAARPALAGAGSFSAAPPTPARPSALDALVGAAAGLLGADLLVAFAWRDDRTAVVRAAHPPLPDAARGTLTLDRTLVAAAGGAVLETTAPRRLVSSALHGALPARPSAAWVLAAPTDGVAGAAADPPPRGGLLAVWCGGRGPDPALLDAGRRGPLPAMLARALAADAEADADVAPRFDAVMAAVPQAVVFVADDGTGLVNAAAAALLDVPAGPVAPGDLAERMAALRAGAANAPAIAARAATLWRDGARVDGADGWVWHFDAPVRRALRVATAPVARDGSRGRLWTFDDVTADVAAADALRAAQAAAAAAAGELAALFAAMRDIVLVIDRAGTYVRVVPTALDLLVGPPEALLGRRVHDVLPAGEADRVLTMVRRALDTGRPAEVAYALDLLAGRAWFAGTASPLGDDTVLWVARDVTARKTTEAALAASEARHRLLFDRSPVPAWVYDGETLAFLAANAAAEALYGYTTDQFLGGLTIRDLHRGEPAAAFDAQRAAPDAGPLLGVRRRHWTRDGRPLEVETSSHPVAFAGRAARLVIAQDVTARVRAEAARRASEARFRAALEASPDACLLLETVRGADGGVADFAVVEANAGAGALYGLPREAVLGRTLRELFPSTPADDVLARYVAVAETGAPYEGEYRTRDPRARAAWLWLQAVALRGADGDVVGLAVTARDVTARKRAEGARRLLHEVTAALGAASDVEGALGAALRAMCEATGMPYGEAWVPAADTAPAAARDAASDAWVRGPAWHAPDDDRLAAFERESRTHTFAPGLGLPGRAVVAGAPVWLSDVTAPGADFLRASSAARAGLRGGLAVPVVADGAVVAVLAFHARHAGAVDAAELDRLAAVAAQVGAVVRRRQAEAALGRERAFLTAVLDSLSEGVVACDADGRPTVFNRAAREVRGLPADGAALPPSGAEHHGVYRADGVTPLAREELPLMRVLRDGDLRAVEVVVAAPGRAPRTVAASGRRLTDAGGRVLGAVVAMHDVTERVEAERRKSEFVSVVSHELRTPLTSIRGALGLLEGGAAGALPDKARSLVAVAKGNAERLVRLVTDVLDLEKIEAGQMAYAMAPLETADVVHAAAEGIAGMAAAARVEVRARVEARAAVLGDRDRLLQVLTNLLSNAIKFSPAHAAVVVSARDVADAAGQPAVRFAVEDVGPGIPADKLALLFQKFRQLDGSDSRRHGGTGLGLAITKTIVEQHGGRVGVESEPGRRTTFWCDLPPHQPPGTASDV